MSFPKTLMYKIPKLALISSYIKLYQFSSKELLLRFHAKKANMSTKRKIIIDCDAGTDDAGAIMMALAYQHVEVVAVTCVFGNTEVENVVNNVLRVLKLCGRLDVSKTCNVLLGVFGKQ